jgi:TfuA protein
MRPVVFVGPSIDADTVRGAIDAELLPPVRRGDIEDLFRRVDPPSHVGIVDGVFLQGLAVSPKEILTEIEHRDVVFFGSSSMGALRAAELAGYGMIGVGEIFRRYHEGDLDADDEVAITFDAESLRPMSEPMVNIRIAVEAAAGRGVVTASTADTAIEAAKALYFPDRSYANVLRVLDGRVDGSELAALRAFLLDDPPNAKRDDALALLAAIRTATTNGRC